MRVSMLVARVALTAMAACCVLAGCGTSAPTRFFTVEPTAPGAVARASYVGPPVRVAAVRPPPAWERPEIVREVAPGRLELLEFERWAAPLGRSLRQVLVEDLVARLPPGAVLVGDASAADRVSIAIDILSIHVDAAQAALQAGWTVRVADAGPVRRHVATASVPVGAEGGVDGAVTSRALGDLMSELADRIAASLDVDSGKPASGPTQRRRLDEHQGSAIRP